MKVKNHSSKTESIKKKWVYMYKYLANKKKLLEIKCAHRLKSSIEGLEVY